MLSIKNVYADFGEFCLKNINLSINPQEKIAIVGESGSGKSLLSQIILGLVKPLSLKGEILFLDSNLIQSGFKNIRGNQIAYIPQSPLSALNPLHTIQKQILEMFDIHHIRLSYKQRETMLDDSLKRVGLPLDIKNRFPHTLSGGQRQRVLIAMMSILKPKLLICDEPTTALDASIQKQILELLASFSDMAILLISHDLSVVRHFAQKVIVMKEGEIVEYGTNEEIFSAPKNPYTKLLLDSIHLPRIQTIPNTNVLLECKDFGVIYTKRKFFYSTKINALCHMDFTLKQSQSFGIIGESGSGKSSFALGILGLIQTQGELIFQGLALQSIKRDKAFRNAVQIVFQDPLSALNPRFCVYEIIAEALDSKLESKERLEHILTLLARVNLDSSFLYRYPESLSGGQNQRVAIARALAKNPKILILDEPTSALDKTTQKIILELLISLRATLNLSYIFISHDLDVIEAMCDEVIVLKDGAVLECGKTQEVFSTPKSQYTQMLLESRF